MDDRAETPEAMIERIGAAARRAARRLAAAPGAVRARAIREGATALRDRTGAIAEANAADIAFGREKGLSAAMLDRLALDPARIEGIAAGLEAVAAQPDPVGAVIAEWDRPSGLHIQRVRTPIGVIGVIYESRPNVTADAGALCLKSGNAAILRGGSESFHSSGAILDALRDGLGVAGLPETSVQTVPTRDRAAVSAMLGAATHIDVIVPRGGKGLVGLVQREARVPVFAHLEGVCHIYLDRAAEAETARAVVLNAKTRRPGICGAAECLLIDRAVAGTAGRATVAGLIEAGVTVHGCPAAQALDPRVSPATAEDWGREYLSMDIAARVVEGVDEAIAHIRTHGSQHTDCILTEDDATAATFFAGLDSAILMRNASTQFADGGEFGMGAEIGIATGKLHARGPVGAEQLTTFQYRVTGDGTLRP